MSLANPDKPQGPGLNQKLAVTPEELKLYQDCAFSLYLKAGLPFAAICHLYSSYRTALGTAPVSPARRAFVFLGNVFLGGLVFSPICYKKLVKMHAEIEERNVASQFQPGRPDSPEESQARNPTVQTEEFSYPIDQLGRLDDPVDNFSSDFSYTKLLPDDDTVVKPKPKTPTYDDLRARNRNSSSKSNAPLASTINSDSGPGSSTLLKPITKPENTEKPPSVPRPQKVKRNLYGDEIE